MTRLHKHPVTLQAVLLLSLVIVFAINLYGLLEGISIVLPHLFYIPIILASFFYPRRGILFTICLSFLYLAMVFVVEPGGTNDIISAAARCGVFIVIAAVVSWLSGQVLAREKALLLAKEEWEHTFDSVPDLIAIIDKEHRIVRVNRAMAGALGILPGEAEGKRCYELVHKSGTPPAICPHTQLLHDGKEHFAEVHEDNLGGDFYVTTTPLYDPAGVLIGSVHISRDITMRKRSEKALQENEEKYRSIIENLEDMFYRTDISGTIVMASPSSAKILGFDSPEEMIGMDIKTMYADPADREKFLAELRERGTVYGYPVTWKRRDGSLFYVTVNGHFIRDVSGEITGVEGIVHDITPQRLAEERLRLTNKKLNLLSGITRHDIRNQLMILKGYLDLSRDAIEDTARLSDYIAMEERAADAIDRQITFTKEYQDLGVIAPAWQGVRACVDQAVASLPMGQIRVIAGPDNLELLADPLLAKVFYNFIDNSLRYGGEYMTTIRISGFVRDSSLILVYNDDGAGIRIEDKPKLFTKGFGKNTGLGLFLSREILSITGITIIENGVPGKGARFELTVPAGAFRFTHPAG